MERAEDDTHTKNRLTIVLAYEREDAVLKDELNQHLTVISRFLGVELWTDDLIAPGSDWRKELDSVFGRADIALLLVSSPFLSSKLVLEVIEPGLLAQHAARGLIVVPIILRPCAWEKHPWIERLQVLPRSRVPITGQVDRDKVFTEVAQDIAKLAQGRQGGLNGSRLPPIVERPGEPIERQCLPAGVIKSKSVRRLLIVVIAVVALVPICTAALYKLWPQPREFAGHVLDFMSGRPLSGAHVLLLGTDCTADTSSNGFFKLQCDMLENIHLEKPRIAVKLNGSDVWCRGFELTPLPTSTLIYLTVDEKGCQGKLDVGVPDIIKDHHAMDELLRMVDGGDSNSGEDGGSKVMDGGPNDGGFVHRAQFAHFPDAGIDGSAESDPSLTEEVIDLDASGEDKSRFGPAVIFSNIATYCSHSLKFTADSFCVESLEKCESRRAMRTPGDALVADEFSACTRSTQAYCYLSGNKDNATGLVVSCAETLEACKRRSKGETALVLAHCTQVGGLEVELVE